MRAHILFRRFVRRSDWSRPRRPGSGSQSGSATPTMLAVMVVIAVAIVGLAQAGRHGMDTASAQTAADAAALAGSLDGRSAAQSLASANGAELIAYEERSDGSVDVSVRIGRAVAHARALLGFPGDGGDEPTDSQSSSDHRSSGVVPSSAPKSQVAPG
jgi:hypothetical protein